MIVFSENGMFSHGKDIQEVISQTESEQISESLKEKLFSKELLFVWLERIWVLGIASLGFYSFLTAIQLKKRIKNENIKVYDKSIKRVHQETVHRLIHGFLQITSYIL